jgi:filamentous hemagglutinin
VERAAAEKAAAAAMAAAREQQIMLSNFHVDRVTSDLAGIRTSENVFIVVNPEKTTTVLGRWRIDLQSIVEQQLIIEKSVTFGTTKGSFNVLNVTDEIVAAAGNRFFEQVNKPFLDAAIKRGDDIALATIPKLKDNVMTPTDELRNYFARELEYLVRAGVKPSNVSAADWTKIQGWFK